MFGLFSNYRYDAYYKGKRVYLNVTWNKMMIMRAYLILDWVRRADRVSTVKLPRKPKKMRTKKSWGKRKFSKVITPIPAYLSKKKTGETYEIQNPL